MGIAMTPQEVEQSLQVVRSTLPQFSRKIVLEIFRLRKIFKLMEAFNRVSRGNTGSKMVWNVFNKLPDVVPGVRLNNIVFPDHQYGEKAELDWRGYYSADSVHTWDMDLNGGPEKIYDIWGTKLAMLGEGIRQHLTGEFFRDGSVAASGDVWHGLDTIMQFTACQAGDRVALPSQTNYAGRSCVLAATGGNWTTAVPGAWNASLTTDWPMGKGDPKYDYYSPLGLNHHSSAWGTGVQTFKGNCEVLLRTAKVILERNGGLVPDAVQNTTLEGIPEDEIQNASGNPPLMHMLSSDLYLDFEAFFAARNYQFVPLPQMVELGFPGMMHLDGCLVDHDWTVDPQVGYGLSFGAMELRLAGQNDLVAIVGPINKPEEERQLAYVKSRGNFRWRPKCFAKYAHFTTA